MGTVELPGFGELEGWRLTFMIVGIPFITMLSTVKELARPAVRPGGDSSAGSHAVHNRSPARNGLPHIGVAVFIMVVFGSTLGPTYLIRTFGFTPADAGMKFGTIMMVLGTAGLLAAAPLQTPVARGRNNAYPLVILISCSACCPLCWVWDG